MKYLYIGSGILVVLLALCIWSSLIISNRAGEARQEVVQAVEALNRGSFQEAAQCARRAADIWNRHEKLFSSMLSHNELDEVDSAFAELEASILAGSIEDFRESSSVLLVQLRHIAEKDIPYHYNLLSADFFYQKDFFLAESSGK